MDKWLEFIFVVVVFGFVLFLEFLDWQGRAEIIESKYPRLWKLVNNRPARFLLMVLAIGLLIKDFKDATAGEWLQSFVIQPLSLHTL